MEVEVPTSTSNNGAGNSTRHKNVSCIEKQETVKDAAAICEKKEKLEFVRTDYIVLDKVIRMNRKYTL
jgi:hypothetical protein